jgi:hypothetical protein
MVWVCLFPEQLVAPVLHCTYHPLTSTTECAQITSLCPKPGLVRAVQVVSIGIVDCSCSAKVAPIHYSRKNMYM